MNLTTPKRSTLLRTTALAAPSVRVANAAGNDTPSRNMMLAWHTNVALRWLDSQQHYRGATPNHFINVVHDPLIGRRQSAVLEFDSWPQLDGALLDAKWSYGKHHGAWGKVLRDKTDGVEILDDHSSLSSSKDRPLTFRGCFAPQMSAAPGGSSRPNTIRTSDKRSLRVESQAA